jgi:acetyl esterase/lipase
MICSLRTTLAPCATAVVVSLAGARAAHAQSPTGACDRAAIPAITAGYGADGPYAMDEASATNPAFRREPVRIFLPRGAEAKRPVVFFSHGFGPGAWETYGDLIRHIVSRGYAVIFSTYPVARATLDGRYDDLWTGFVAAARREADRLDLTRVAFVGHSFGGGASPAMAYRGLVRQGWGSRGAFLYALAPWYALEMRDSQLAALPTGVPQVYEVYDQDTTNDPRMALDLYDRAPRGNRFFFEVQSDTVSGCVLTADHSTPGRNPSIRQKAYGVFRPFDALAAWIFDGDASARDSLAAMGVGTPSAGYQPLRRRLRPTPNDAGRTYRYPWNDRQNPRRAGE